jgi:hypothetical protein
MIDAHRHAVDLAAAAGQECDCNDQRFRGGNCKHVLAAQLSVLGPGILAGLRELLPWAAGREKAM